MVKKRSGSSTPATIALARLQIEFTIRNYAHDPRITDFGAEAAQALGVNPSRVFKTLLVVAGATLIVGIVPVAGLLDLKAIAAAVGERKAEMADPKLAERKTGYVVGGISPVGQRTKIATVLDDSALQFETVFVSGGRRGLDIELSPTDLLRATEASIFAIAKPRL